MFIDSHAHLEMEQFAADRGEVLFRARDAGVEGILAIGSGTGPGSLDCAIRLAHGHDWLWATVGIHPHEAKLATEEDWAELQRLAREPKVIAWGEIGLDYFYEHSPREVQRAAFVKQIAMAQAAELPIVIHCRPSQASDNAWEECFELLRRHWAGRTGTFHCFTGTPEQAREALELGFMVSFAGNVSFAKALDIREAAKLVPLDRMLIETDAPFLAPVPHRGKRNEPAFVAETARAIAELRGVTQEEIGRATTENFYRFFGGFNRPLKGAPPAR